MEPQKPSIGRIVHFYGEGLDEPQAALVVAVHSNTSVDLNVCNKSGTWSVRQSVELGEDGPVDGTVSDAPAGAHWVWPPRV